MTVWRSLLLALSVIQASLAIGFFAQVPIVIGLWPYPGTSPLTNIFLASILAAAAASTAWAVWSRNAGALVGIGLDYVVIFGFVAVLSFALRGELVAFGFVCLSGVLFGAGLVAWSWRRPLDRSAPLPGLVRWSFVLFVVTLVVVAGLLFARTPNVIPWTITPDLSLVIGAMFLGAAGYFLYGIARPSWANAAGQLLGFLAYDLVLVGPFLARLPTVPSEHLIGLLIYLAVIFYSGALAIVYLFVNRPTRAATWRRAGG